MFTFKTNKKEISVQGFDIVEAFNQAKKYCTSDKEVQSLRYVPKDGISIGVKI